MADTGETEKKDTNVQVSSGQCITYGLKKTDEKSDISIFKILGLDIIVSEEDKPE